MKDLIIKSIASSVCLSIAVPLLLTNPIIGSFLFSLGLFCVCTFKLKLFTGIAGFVIEDHIPLKDIFFILLFNLISGYIFGFIFSLYNNDLIAIAINKVNSWSLSYQFFIGSFACGMLMYIAVKLYKIGKPIGIFMAVPLFLLSGFQHSIANSIVMGVSRSFNAAILLAIVGNFVGSIFLWFITRNRTLSEKD